MAQPRQLELFPDNHGLPDTVANAIRRRFPEEADEILPQVGHDTLNGCYWFGRWGMYFGV